MMTGTVKWFNDANGFGFITPGNGGQDLFVHAFSIDGGARAPVEGQSVSFVVEQSPKGPQAVQVTVSD